MNTLISTNAPEHLGASSRTRPPRVAIGPSSFTWLSILLAVGSVLLGGCASTQRHFSVVSPSPPPKVEKDFDFSQMSRYQAALNAYTEAAEGAVAASTAAAAGGAPCPASRMPPNEAAKLAFCTQDGKLVAEVQDSSGNLVGTATTSISISSTPPGVTGATTVAAVGGVATFDQLFLNSPGSYTLTAAASNLTPAVTSVFTVAINLDRAKYFRNKIVDGFTGDIDHVYGQYVNLLYAGKGFEAVGFDFINLGLTAASSISLVKQTKTILSALATGVSGVGLSIDKNFFGQQTFAALAIAMQARRDEGRISINKNEQLSVTDYSIESARRDLISYFYAGTLPGAIQEIQQEAATKSSNVTGKPAVGTAAKLTFHQTSNANVGTAIPVQVAVEDSNGNVVTSAANSIMITSTPSGVTGTLTVAAVNGVATFNLTFPAKGSYTLAASSTGLTSATSDAITVVAANATPPPALTKPAIRPRASEGLH